MWESITMWVTMAIRAVLCSRNSGDLPKFGGFKKIAQETADYSVLFSKWLKTTPKCFRILLNGHKGSKKCTEFKAPEKLPKSFNFFVIEKV